MTRRAMINLSELRRKFKGFSIQSGILDARANSCVLILRTFAGVLHAAGANRNADNLSAF
jgi:hypothetical protein